MDVVGAVSAGVLATELHSFRVDLDRVNSAARREHGRLDRDGAGTRTDVPHHRVRTDAKSGERVPCQNPIGFRIICGG